MAKRFSGKVAVVTGASKGIGAKIATDFGREGASVVVNYASDKEGAMRVVKEIEKHGSKARAVKANMADQKEILHHFSETKKAFGKVDTLVNNAGIYEFFPLDKITPANFHKTFDINVLGLLLASREAVKLMKEGGSIVNISSIASTATMPETMVYSASKGAVDAITRALGAELGPKKIRVNTVRPGMVETEGTHSTGLMKGDFRNQIESQTPLKRIGQPGDVASLVLFLASDEASWITCSDILIAGGDR